MTTESTDRALTVTNSGRAFDDATLAEFTGYADVAAAFQTNGLPLDSITDYGTGFVLTDKAALVGVPFVIVQWRFNAGKYGEEFVSVEAITKHDEKVIFNDGSTGVARQLRGVTDKRNREGSAFPQAGLIVAGGLSRTDYFYNEDTRETSSVPMTGKGWAPASTYYLAG